MLIMEDAEGYSGLLPTEGSSTLKAVYIGAGLLRPNPQAASFWLAYKMKRVMSLKSHDSPIGQNRLNIVFTPKKDISEEEFIRLANEHLFKYKYRVTSIVPFAVKKIPPPAKEAVVAVANAITAPLRSSMFLLRNAKWILIGTVGITGLVYARPVFSIIANLTKRR